jgi:hypothetical protein
MIEKAVEQLSRKYLHPRGQDRRVLDFFIETYLKEGAPRGLSSPNGWRPTMIALVRARFLKTWKSRTNLDQLLRRE